MWYILNIIAVSLALLYLAKDWAAHKTSWRRAAILILIILSGIGGAIHYYYTNKDNEAQHKSDQEQISGLKAQVSGLKGAVETANNNQKENTKVFVAALGKLSEKVSDLREKDSQQQGELLRNQQRMQDQQTEIKDMQTAIKNEVHELVKQGKISTKDAKEILTAVGAVGGFSSDIKTQTPDDAK